MHLIVDLSEFVSESDIGVTSSHNYPFYELASNRRWFIHMLINFDVVVV